MQPLFDEMVPIHEGKLHELKIVRDQLSAEGLDAEIIRPPGCSTSS